MLGVTHSLRRVMVSVHRVQDCAFIDLLFAMEFTIVLKAIFQTNNIVSLCRIQSLNQFL